MLKEFKTFIARGNVIDMAVGIIVGAAFTSIVKSLVNNLIGLFIGRIDLSNLVLTVGDAQFKYGSFLNAVINFLIISFVVFLMVKAINTFRKKEDKKTETPSEEVMYLKEIAELLKKNKK